MKFYCIADEDTVRGFQLAGIAGQAVVNAQQASTALAHAAALPEFGVLILTEAVAAGIRDQVDRIRFEQTSPLVVEIPGPEGPSLKRKSLTQLVHEAAGIHVGPGGN